MDLEVLKRALRELAEREPAFFRDLFLEAIRGDGRAAELLAELLTKYQRRGENSPRQSPLPSQYPST